MNNQDKRKEAIKAALTASALVMMILAFTPKAHASDIADYDVEETSTGYNIGVNTGLTKPLPTRDLSKERVESVNKELETIRKNRNKNKKKTFPFDPTKPMDKPEERR